MLKSRGEWTKGRRSERKQFGVAHKDDGDDRLICERFDTHLKFHIVTSSHSLKCSEPCSQGPAGH